LLSHSYNLFTFYKQIFFFVKRMPWKTYKSYLILGKNFGRQKIMPIPQKNTIVVEEVPIKYIHSDWETAFEKGQSVVLPICCLPASKAFNKYLSVETARWRILLHWVVKKKWCSKLKIPGGRKIAKSLEASGENLKQVLELCIQLHPFSRYRYSYSDAADWFTEIIDEVRCAEIQAFQERSRTGNEGEAQLTKDTCSNISGSLRGSEPINPFCPESEPHIWGLIELALEQADRSDRFRKTYWKDFLKSLVAINKKHKQGGEITLVEVDGELMACEGQGRGKKTYF
jgi:hypothetical protein